MATIVTRSGKGSALTIAEVDSNFNNLNNFKSEITGITGALTVPAGTQAQRPTGTQGFFRFNTDTAKFEGFNGSVWSGIGGGATISSVAASTTYYLGLSSITTGEWVDARVAASDLYYTSGDSTLYATNFNTSSDIELKDNVQKITGSIEVISNLQGVGFNWKKSGEKSYGVIAQEIEKVLPELVKTVDDVKSVNYIALIGFLIEAVKELNAKVESLSNGI